MDSQYISKLATRYTSYDMITTHTALPKFPEHRIDLLCAFLQRGALDQTVETEDRELYGLAISLMQMGLDTHDMVSGHESPANKAAMRSNQLKVLAGDYFSSRFYQLLAKRGYVDFIRVISQAICELNRIKMDFYMNLQQFRMTAEEYIKQSALIKMQLFLPFKHMMKQSFSELWLALLHHISHCEVIIEQLALDEDKLQAQNNWGFWFKRKHQVNNVREALTAMLEKHVISLQEHMKRIDSEQMSAHVERIKDVFKRQLDIYGKEYEVQA